MNDLCGSAAKPLSESAAGGKKTNSGHHVHEIVDFVTVSKRASSRPASQIWHLMQISDGLDSDDIRFLRKQNIEMYRPLIRMLKPVPRNKLSHSQRRSGIRPMREKIAPFFPGYAFIDFTDAGDRWREIFQITRIRGLATANNLPLKVEWSVIEKIQAREIDGAVPGETDIADFAFLIGEEVRIGAGPFASFTGTIEGFLDISTGEDGSPALEDLDDSQRVQLLVNIFGRQTPVVLPVADIDKLYQGD